MKILKSVWLPLLLVAGLACASTTTVRSSIDRQYKKWASAALSNDVEGVLSILAPDYTLKTFDGKMIPLKDYEVSLRKRKAGGQKPTVYTTSIQSLSVSGAKVEVVSLETSVKDTPDPITNKIQKLVHIHQYLDTWVKLGGHWKLRSTVTQVEKTTVKK